MRFDGEFDTVRGCALAAVAGALCVVAAAGCGGGGRRVRHAVFGRLAGPACGGRELPASFEPQPPRDLIGNMLQGPVLAPSVTLLGRAGTASASPCSTAAERQIGDLEVVLYVAKGLDETAHGPYPARFEPIDVKPQFRSQTTSRGPRRGALGLRRGPHVLAAGLVSGLGRDEAGPRARRHVARADAGALVEPGSRRGRQGDLVAHADRRIGGAATSKRSTRASRRTPCTTSISRIRSTGTGPWCCCSRRRRSVKSRVCGPVTDVAEQVKSEYGDRADFIHMEIYNDNDVNKGVRPQFAALGAASEPFLFAINRRGIVAARIEGAFSAPELKAAVRKALH